jgi:prenyltransferase beta subunit
LLVDPLLALQTYEGGLGGEPGNEAHGGYTFCGLAALALIRQESVLDLPALLHWATQVSMITRQGVLKKLVLKLILIAISVLGSTSRC